MKADYVHKDSKTSTNETILNKITMPLIDTEELQRIDNNYNELVDEFIKQFVKDKDMIIARRIIMNLRKENEQLHIESQKLKEKINKIQTIANYEYDFYDNTEDLIEDIRKILGILSEVE